MASVTLEEAWFHDADNLATYVAAPLSEAAESAERDGEVRRYAGGRLRVIAGPSRPSSVAVTLASADRAVVDQLRAWKGKRLFYRDPRGRAQFGTFFSLQIVEIPGTGADVADVSLTLESVSGTVEV